MKTFVLLKDTDRRVIIDTDCILSVEDVTKEDGNDYVAVVTPQSIFYYTNYTRDVLVLKFTQAIQFGLEPNTPVIGKKPEAVSQFFTFPVEGKMISVRIDNIDYIDETDMEEEYFFEVSTKDGHIYTCNEIRIDDDVLRSLDRYVVFIDSENEQTMNDNVLTLSDRRIVYDWTKKYERAGA